MKILDISKFKEITENISLTIGFFDGFHIGHQKIISEMKNYSKLNNLKTVVITFDDSLILKFKMSNVLSLFAEKVEIFNSLNVDYLLIINENSDILSFSADMFYEKVLSKMNIKCFVSGKDFSFGSDKKGNADYILNKNICEVKVVDDILIDGEKITSSYLRNLINNGSIEIANKYLYKTFYIESKVISGKKIGRTIDYKTANLSYCKKMDVLKHGVYFGYIYVNNVQYITMINVGYNPTIDDSTILKVEAYIVDFNENIYSQDVVVEFLSYYRKEIKFENVDKLKQQLNIDKQNLINYFSIK